MWGERWCHACSCLGLNAWAGMPTGGVTLPGRRADGSPSTLSGDGDNGGQPNMPWTAADPSVAVQGSSLR